MRDSTLNRLTDRALAKDQNLLGSSRTRAELIDLGFGIYRDIGWKILRETFLPSVIASILIICTLSYVFPNVFSTSQPDSTTAQVGEIALYLAGTTFVAVPALMAVLSFASAIVCHMTSAYLRGEKVDAVEAGRTARRLIGALSFASLFSLWPAILILVGSVGLLVASAFSSGNNTILDGLSAFLGLIGILLALLAVPLVTSRYGIVPVVVVIEGLRGRAAARRARSLMSKTFSQPSGDDIYGSVWGLVLLLVLLGVLGVGGLFQLMDAAGYLESFSAGSASGQVVGSLVSLLPTVLVLWAVVPVWCVMSTVIYFDRRIRLEGLDIEVLAQAARRKPSVASFIP